MWNLTRLPLIDDFKTTLTQSWNGSTGSMSVSSTPTFTFPAWQTTCVIVNPWKTTAQLAEIDSYDAVNKTLNVSNVWLEKWAWVNYWTYTHSVQSEVIISNNYQFWKDILTAINTKLDNDWGNTTTTFDLQVSWSSFRIRLDGGDMKFTDDNNVEIDLSTIAAAAGADRKVTVSANDTTPWTLEEKISAWSWITISTLNEWADEELQLAFDPSVIPSVSIFTQTITAWEDLTSHAWKPWFIFTWWTEDLQFDQNSHNSFDNADVVSWASGYFWQTYTVPWTGNVDINNFYYYRIWAGSSSSVDRSRAFIYDDDSKTTLLWTSDWNNHWSSSNTNILMNFSTPAVVTGWTQIYVHIQTNRSSGSWSSNFRYRTSTADPYSWGQRYKWDTPVAQTWEDLYFWINLTWELKTTWRVYLSDASDKSLTKFNWIIKQGATEWNNILLDTWVGITTSVTWLTVWEQFIQDGGWLWITSWTNTYNIWIATSSTSLYISNYAAAPAIPDYVTATRSNTAGSWTVTYSHNLWQIPSMIDVTATHGGWSSASPYSRGIWKNDWSNTNRCIFNQSWWTTWNIDTNDCIRIHETDSDGQEWRIQNVTATTFDVVWNYTSSPSSRTFAMIFILTP